MKSKQIGRAQVEKATEFSKMLEQSFKGLADLQAGSIHNVKVTNTKDKNYVFVSLDDGQGLIPRTELEDADGQITVNEGERIKVFYVFSEKGELIFTTKPVGPAAYAIVEQAFMEKQPVKADSIRQIKGGYEILLGEVRAFCPASQMLDEEDMPFLITEVQGKRVIVSRKALREIQRDEQKELLQGKLEVGDVVAGKIVSLQNFGAFVDLGGIEALIPISEIAFQRLGHPSEELSAGDEVRARVLSIDWKEDRITLSRKALLENPWQGKLPFGQGELLDGVVESIKNFGIFVSLKDNFTGLVPMVESGIPRGQNATGVYAKDQKIRVMIMSIDRDKERISLSIKQVAEADTRQEYQDYMVKMNTQDETSDPVSSFGKQLQQAMKKSK